MKSNTIRIGYILLCIILIAGIGNSVVSAQDGAPQASQQVFIPMLNKGTSGNQTITGRVLSEQNVPIAGVSISTNQGQSAITDQNGNYSLVGLGQGTYTLTPSDGVLKFSPASSSVVVPPDVKMLNFTAQVTCSEAIINSGFEDSSGWEFPATEYTAGYTTSEAHSGSRSARTGIVVPADNRFSYSSTRQKVTIPSGTTSAYLTFWIKPFSEQVQQGLSLPAMPASGTQADQAPLSTDVQYVLVLDSNFNIINTLIWQISDSRTWTQYQFSLAAYAGRTIYLHFGTFNDGLDGISSMFVDDVSLQICPGGSPTPPPTPVPCGNLFRNPSFESTSDWEIPLTAFPAGYSTTQAHTGSRSMRTGILNTNENTFSYSDFRQRISIPAGAPLARASFWLYTLSGEAKGLSQPEMITPTGRPFSETPLSGDVQYVLILDSAQNWIDTLVWQRTDEGYWHYFEFDLRRYAGHTIYLQFGTFNDGVNGISSMFVDDAALDTCTNTPTPGPSPTPGPTATPAPCQELIVNNNFEGGNGWQILNTHYPAGYSNAQYHSAFRSMRTGIIDPAQNTYSYSDFRQVVSIPSNTHHVTLSIWLYPTSGESAVGMLPEPARTQHFGDQPMSSDAQYVLILDQSQNWIGTLVWMRSNSNTWTNMQFDLSGYAGWTIMLQWGTYNNGTDGITSMYVDDVNLQACP